VVTVGGVVLGLDMRAVIPVCQLYGLDRQETLIIIKKLKHIENIGYFSWEAPLKKYHKEREKAAKKGAKKKNGNRH